MKNLLKKDKVEEALAYLETHAPTQGILLQAQIHRAAKNVQFGMEGSEREATIRQRTIEAILVWVEEMQETK